VQTAINNGQFKTLATALQAAGLVGTLKGRGPFTVFAPTDAAFSRLPPGALNSLLRPENRHQLINILQYHVIGGRALTAAQILWMPQPIRLHMLSGRAVAVTPTGRQVRINNANLVAANVQATNGIIHVIDRVLGF
jgi:uncharacterized surface protein with fasciclin (FAS1) repeats